MTASGKRFTLENLDQTELALIDCHEYDLLRKKLIAFGLTPNDLSYMGLKAIEENKIDLKKLVEIHEILYSLCIFINILCFRSDFCISF